MSHCPSGPSPETPTHCSLGFQTHLLWVCLLCHGCFLSLECSCCTDWLSVLNRSTMQWISFFGTRSQGRVLDLQVGPASRDGFPLRCPLQSQDH